MIWPRTSIGSGVPASIRGSRRAWAASRAVYITPVMRTRSPAFSDSTSASERGGVTSLTPSAPAMTITPAPLSPPGRAPGSGAPTSPVSQRHFLVSMRVALDRHRHRQARDVARVGENVDAERGGIPAVTLGADAEPVGPLEHLPLHRGYRRIRIRRAQLAEERLLAEPRGLLEGAAQPHPRDQRRARVGSRGADALEDPLLDPIHPLRGGQHLVLRAVLAAAPLGHDLDLEMCAGDHVQVNHGGRVVAGVHPVERRAHDGGAEVALPVALAHTLVDGLVEASPGHVHVLPQLEEADHEAGVLAVGDLPGAGQLRVLLQDLEHLAAGGRALLLERTGEGAQHVGLERVVRLHAELLDRVDDGGDVDLAHALLLGHRGEELLDRSEAVAPDLGVHRLAVRARDPHDLARAERLLVELDRLLAVLDGQGRGDAVVALWNRLRHVERSSMAALHPSDHPSPLRPPLTAALSPEGRGSEVRVSACRRARGPRRPTCRRRPARPSAA